MKIKVVQMNSSLGDFEKNFNLIKNSISVAAREGCHLVVFPEAALFGYFPADLLERTEAVAEQERYLKKLSHFIPQGLAVLVGCFSFSGQKGRPFYNSAALLRSNKSLQYFHKTLLPVGDIFDEGRFIKAGTQVDKTFSHNGKKILVTICEDIWAWDVKGYASPYEVNPLVSMRPKKIDLVVNISASPYHYGKWPIREQVVRKVARHFKAPVIYTNMVGTQDEVIFDGQSFAMNANGKVLQVAKAFSEDQFIFDMSQHQKTVNTEQAPEASSLLQALTFGIKDFCTKNKIQKVHLGLSGGIDSSVVVALAVKALGPENVTGLTLTGPFTSRESLTLAHQLAKNLNVKVLDVPITPAFNSLKKLYRDTFHKSKSSLMEENLQARLRAVTLMAYSNATNSMLLSTSNKSEIATGYSTLYGDMCGGLAVLGDLTKRQVYAIANELNKSGELIPKRIIRRPPTAELKKNQKDQDTLPPYKALDESVVRIVEKKAKAKNSVDLFVLDSLLKSEFKRWQSPPILRVSSHAFGRGRRFPITNNFRESKV